jgi:hypothetical protein
LLSRCLPSRFLLIALIADFVEQMENKNEVDKPLVHIDRTIDSSPPVQLKVSYNKPLEAKTPIQLIVIRGTGLDEKVFRTETIANLLVSGDLPSYVQAMFSLAPHMVLEFLESGPLEFEEVENTTALTMKISLPVGLSVFSSELLLEQENDSQKDLLFILDHAKKMESVIQKQKLQIQEIEMRLEIETNRLKPTCLIGSQNQTPTGLLDEGSPEFQSYLHDLLLEQNDVYERAFATLSGVGPKHLKFLECLKVVRQTKRWTDQEMIEIIFQTYLRFYSAIPISAVSPAAYSSGCAYSRWDVTIAFTFQVVPDPKRYKIHNVGKKGANHSIPVTGLSMGPHGKSPTLHTQFLSFEMDLV